jgi:RNA polymerase sigma factor (sigma-70 family)
MCSIHQNSPAARGDWGCAQGGCRACQDALIREHTGLIHAVLRRVAHAGIPYEELVQAGRLALWQAVLGFDPRRGTQFSTYGWRVIERGLWQAVRQARQPEGDLLEVTPPAALWSYPEVHTALRAAVQQLPERLRAVLSAIYGLDGQSPCSRAALGRTWGLSRERIRQLHDQALATLRHPGFSAELYQLCEQDTRAAYLRALQSTRAWQREQRR